MAKAPAKAKPKAKAKKKGVAPLASQPVAAPAAQPVAAPVAQPAPAPAAQPAAAPVAPPREAAPAPAAAPPKPPSQPTPQSPAPAAREFDLFSISDVIDVAQADEGIFQRELHKHIGKIVARHKLEDYTVVMMIDETDPISAFHANAAYNAVSAANKAKDVLMILGSGGGSIEAGFLLSKTCKRMAKDKFIVAIPRKAKSAATLIALGADQIHMGIMSELGPIDPQIGGFPALGVQNSLGVLAELVCKYPESAELFARYLSRSLQLPHLGYFARVPESAAQYAERLLRGKTLGQGQTPATLAKHFVEHYKDHAFVIDIDESQGLLGPMVAQGSTEYRAANEIYQFLDSLNGWRRVFSDAREVWYVGTIDRCFGSRKAKK